MAQDARLVDFGKKRLRRLLQERRRREKTLRSLAEKKGEADLLVEELGREEGRRLSSQISQKDSELAALDRVIATAERWLVTAWTADPDELVPDWMTE